MQVVFCYHILMNRCPKCGRLTGKNLHACVDTSWNKGRKGYKLTEEHKEKIRLAGIGRKVSEETRRKLSAKNIGNTYNLGKKHSEETLAKMRANNKRATKGKPAHNRGVTGVYKHTAEWIKKYTGKNHPNWRGGISGLNLRIRATHKYYIWRFEIFKRDNFTCVQCKGVRSKKLNVDHIKSFALILKENNIKSLRQAEKCEELWDKTNGQTLCIPCHKETPSYGRMLKL